MQLDTADIQQCSVSKHFITPIDIHRPEMADNTRDLKVKLSTDSTCYTEPRETVISDPLSLEAFPSET